MMAHGIGYSDRRSGKARFAVQGFGVVETMLALSLGLAITMSLLTLLNAVQAQFQTQTDLQDIDDTARFVLAHFSQQLRQAAYVDPFSTVASTVTDDSEGLLAVSGLDAGSRDDLAPELSVAQAKAAKFSDVLALRFHAAAAMAPCNGSASPSGVDAVSIYYVVVSADQHHELMCKYRTYSAAGGRDNWQVQAMISGVDAFQILYALDSSGRGAAWQWLNASMVNQLDAAAPVPSQARTARGSHWHAVRAVRIAMLISGNSRGDGDGRHEAARDYDLFGSDYAQCCGAADRGSTVSSPDLAPAQRQRLRRIVSITLPLRNFSAPVEALASGALTP
ncbi:MULTISPECIES: PilW family protein [unclassified Undibacterium]|uniref:PilW family protein n=1 Tax=unclassified Undibacterium TaxID=2630295 RepID=UPI002AC8C538|nr:MULTISPECIES: PilW family protein [unclassified Undibacterium]MEB0141217.1 PilW family protein [Undibacterium sp. CCC2.1]MEB0174284.1 PilW family protein [Undibacterium sp. CCC1.1]MEB0178220.1 PilW family protein [Undibacterium sp. CCC3.4]MEB0217420.1 PilW family protein [Undibacterium sp. 5I2]WPX42118.1 PilW family protein [Undibacterium sp. CCC3.4]